jgi:tRNA-dihydrouridine synthase
VFGNGDIFAPEDAKRMMETTKCDGVAVGRGALGNPWIYAGICALLTGQKPKLPSFEEKKRVVLDHLRLEIEYEGEKTGILHCRRIAAWYFKGCPNVARLRDKINRATSVKEMCALIEDFGDEASSDRNS